VDADVSISLGLIVTELVINALKHAFPDKRTGTIGIDYRSSGKDWTLSVADNGVGMPGKRRTQGGTGDGHRGRPRKEPGGEITLSNAHPGTVVTITHRETSGRRSDSSAAGTKPLPGR